MASNKLGPLILVLAVIAAVAVATFLVKQTGQRAEDGPDPGAAAETGTVEQVAAEAAARRKPVSRPNRQPADVQAKLEQSVARRAQAREEQIRRTERLKQQAAETFRNEQVDPAWAPQKEGELSGIAAQPAFETAGAVPKEMRIECRSSVCRLDGAFATSGQAEDWVLLYMSSVGSAMSHSVVTRSRNPDGTTRVEIYGRAR